MELKAYDEKLNCNRKNILYNENFRDILFGLYLIGSGIIVLLVSTKSNFGFSEFWRGILFMLLGIISIMECYYQIFKKDMI